MQRIIDGKINLEIKKVYFHFRFTSEMVFDPAFKLSKELRKEHDDAIYGLLIQSRVAIDNMGEVCTKYPANWVQAFKERWFPKWLLKWFPVVIKTNIQELKVLRKNYKEETGK